jgi:hypothetical protein
MQKQQSKGLQDKEDSENGKQKGIKSSTAAHTYVSFGLNKI